MEQEVFVPRGASVVVELKREGASVAKRAAISFRS